MLLLQKANGSHDILGTADMSEEDIFEVKLAHAVKTLASEVLSTSLIVWCM